MLVCLGAGVTVLACKAVRLFGSIYDQCSLDCICPFRLLLLYFYHCRLFFPALFSQLADCKLLAGTASGGLGLVLFLA